MQASNPQGQGQGSSGGMQKPTLSWQSPNNGAQKKVDDKPAMPKMADKPIVKSPAPKSGEKSNLPVYSSIFIGGLVIGALIGWGVTSSHPGSGSLATTGDDHSGIATSTTTENSSDYGASSAGSTASMTGEGLVIPTQAAGLQVSVSNVSVTAPTWVVIYEDHSGVPGNALGAGLFTPKSQGGATSGTIDLLRGTTAGQNYLAGESLDDGDHLFSLQNDKPVRDAQGNPVLVQFSTQ